MVRRKKEYTASKIAITKSRGSSEITEWDMDSIMKRDIRISDSIMAILTEWNNDYLNIPIVRSEYEYFVAIRLIDSEVPS